MSAPAIDARGAWAACALVTVGVAVVLALRTPVPLERQPFPDAVEYADSANRLAHGKGFTTTVDDFPGTHPSVNPPRYPPGYPLYLAPFTLVGDHPDNAQLGAKVVAIMLTVAVAVAAASLAGPWAATLAVVLVGAGTPFLRHSAGLVMSDALGVLLVVVLIPLLRRPSPRLAVLVGLIGGYGVVTRLAGVIVLACLLAVLPGRRRLLAAAGAAVPVTALALWQWRTFGRPWRTGYGYWLPGVKVFGVEFLTSSPRGDGNLIPDQARDHLAHWACSVVHCAHDKASTSVPAWLFYPLVLVGALWIVTPPLVAVGGWVYAATRWRRGDVAARFVVVLPFALAAFYAFYFFEGARFMAPATYPLIVFAAAGAVTCARSFRQRLLPAT